MGMRRDNWKGESKKKRCYKRQKFGMANGTWHFWLLLRWTGHLGKIIVTFFKGRRGIWECPNNRVGEWDH
jgi:hypothetical protein